MKPDLLHCCLGAAGDIIIILPALKAWADEHGKPARLLVAKAYAPLLDGVSYVMPVIFPGSWEDLWPAQILLKTDLPEVPVKVLQFYRKGDDKCLPSFVHEMKYLAGLLDGKEHELVFDRRDPFREQTLIDSLDDGRPMILVATKGNSSPLENAELLMPWIYQNFKDCNVIDLSEVHCERVYDLLGLYDHAAALVSIDTVHLHLSRASKVPVFAIARDYPETWHGTPWDARFRFYCRYGEWWERRHELVDAIRGGISSNPMWVLCGLPKGHYNPSTIIYEGVQFTSSRYHPDRTWKTQLTINGEPVKFPHPVSTYAHEDMRLFHFQGKLMASYVCARGDKTDPKCIQGYGELIHYNGAWYIKEHFQPDMPGNDWSGMEKNMVCFEYNGFLHAIWKNGKVIWLGEGYPKMKLSNHVVNSFESEPATWPYGDIRGGTSPLPYQGKWLRFFHSRIWPEGKAWRYYIGALLMEPEPPFNVLKVSSKPILCGDESGDPMIWHYKPNCCLPFGAIEDGDGWIVSVGINDSESRLLYLKPEDLHL